VGEKFVMASTGFKKEEAEKRTVTDVSADKLTVTFDKAADF